MSSLSLSLIKRKCGWQGCDKSAGVFGFCADHEEPHIRSEFHELVRLGQAESVAPKCFSSEQEYREYAVAASLTRNSGVTVNFRVDHCHDCVPRFREQMVATGRCSHPETVFIRSDRFAGGTVGVALIDPAKSSAWEGAVMGMSGAVVSMPQGDVIDTIITKLSQKKKIGRPRKVRADK